MQAEQQRGMESLRELYRTGRGPSSSHTMGPERACRAFAQKNPTADHFRTVLYGSLAKTGKVHGTDRVIVRTLETMPCTVEWNTERTDLPHPNTMELFAYRGDQEIDRMTVLSVGGGKICTPGAAVAEAARVYPLDTFGDIAAYCRTHGLRLWQYVEQTEGEDISQYIAQAWASMQSCIARGLQDEGILPGGLQVVKKAKTLMEKATWSESAQTRENRMVCSFAFAVGEQNAGGETIVTAPTCGAAGVMPAVLYYVKQTQGYRDEDICHALETGGLIGNLIKTNASISGAECGCQAEIGSACAMAAAALAELYGMGLDEIEYAAEIAIEHHLGLTCDPICGLVQIPCIERNAVAAMRAINAVNLAGFLSDTRKISLDEVIHTMAETGRDINGRYRETSEGGLANLRL